ncbi:hypothetical protein DPMN_083499 [Dreissena polymorpha]|uniref:Uncharacterized protein n=1 Tax=Dreissena polymorpha TaxID=45954 RepID=A0A9D4BIB5_DREPO|nr:hypothetical protein DPMN_083499 [Dreissena polymorpha]
MERVLAVAVTQLDGSVLEPGSLVQEGVVNDMMEDAHVVREWVFVRNAKLTAFDSHF